jgi:hypothetical protein
MEGFIVGENDHIPGRLLSGEDACRFTGLCYRSLYARRMAGEIGYVKLGRLVKYRYEDLVAFVAKHQVSPKSEAVAV